MQFEFSVRQGYQLLRKQKKIKLKELASQIGVSIPMLSMYENEVVNLRKEKEKQYRDYILSAVGNKGEGYL
ncbi:transcriptional regulator with XRE-family HTH domain [Paenibacillus forsythiae]|uniref:Transcriptional regulator with XRE-family HTH domain n=1 Tax=Paenibacillus forsythiae TaxID=365616 RepID=A0ABU3HEG1_9BACL|nr:helix-turn-helix transcriptional regulator [Paenibacillus forsythiae]MDT3429188.1 transcriptional regulator with XRE-family HTH domain [Paenibacillus forsythiae]